MEQMCANIFTKNLQVKEFRELQVELPNYPIYYKYNESIYKDVENI